MIHANKSIHENGAVITSSLHSAGSFASLLCCLAVAGSPKRWRLLVRATATD